MRYIKGVIGLFLLCGVIQLSNVWAGGRYPLPSSATLSPQVPEAISADTTTPRDVDAFKRSWHRKIDKLDKQIAKAQKSLSRASDEGKKNLTSQIDELKAQRDDLQQQVDEAGDKTAEEWNEFKQAVAQKYDTLESGIRDLFKH